eukprot:CAMPEP_0179151184 /NCGR_PEP_ID=MMETSP0796-20121207/73378_1 /TAXON_ID=73915 /ORGANISM="Pyrodinium bahamense, Strain pbaha01" /LENGTH=35 /DNA_ID= /DNA_START= /DNA_END= /DNA_ORIENTATION=
MTMPATGTLGAFLAASEPSLTSKIQGGTSFEKRKP